MKINEILSESRKRTKKIEEAPVSMLGQGARRVGSWALDKLGAVNTAGKLTGIADSGVEANKLSKEFHTYLGRSGIAAPQYEDLVDFLTSKGLTVPNEIQGKTGAMPSKAADKMIMQAVSQPHDLGNSRRAAATQSNTQPSTVNDPASPAPQNPAPASPTNSSVSYSQVKQMVDQLSGNSLVMLKRYVDSKVNKSASNLGLNPGGPNTATPAATPTPSEPKPKKSSKAAPAPANSAKPKKQSAAKPAPVTPPASVTPAAKPARKSRAPAKPSATP